MKLMIDIAGLKITLDQALDQASPLADVKIEPSSDTGKVLSGPKAVLNLKVGPVECERLAAFFDSARRSLSAEGRPL
jgi:hypothetical protein